MAALLVTHLVLEGTCPHQGPVLQLWEGLRKSAPTLGLSGRAIPGRRCGLRGHRAVTMGPWGPRGGGCSWGAQGGPSGQGLETVSELPPRTMERASRTLKDVASPGWSGGSSPASPPGPHKEYSERPTATRHHLPLPRWGHCPSPTPSPHSQRPQRLQAYRNRLGVKKLRLWLLWALIELGLPVKLH